MHSLDRLPNEVIYMICSYLPSRKNISSTCRHLNDVITPESHYYYLLTSSHNIDFPLLLGGDIGLYNRIFDTRYNDWMSVYNNYISDLPKKDIEYLYRHGYNDIVSYVCYISMDINDIHNVVRGDIGELYRIGVLKLVDPHVIPDDILNTLSIDQMLDIFDTNCRKWYLTETHFDILLSHILRYTNVNTVVDHIISVFGKRRYDTYYFIAISIAKIHPNVLPKLLVTVDDVVDFFYMVYNNSETGSLVDVRSVLISIKSAFTLNDRMYIIRRHLRLHSLYREFEVPGKFIAELLYTRALELVRTRNLPINLIPPSDEFDVEDLIEEYRVVIRHALGT
jgi:hypothetical protein